jgi:hypothetical protein
MTVLRSLLGFLAVTAILIVSCKKDHSLENGKIPDIIDASWEFKEGGQLYNGNMDSAYIQSAAGFSALTMIGSQPDNQTGEIILQIVVADVVKGTYSSPDIFFQYSENGNVLFQTIPGQTSDFSITITEIDSSTITGTFSGTVQDSQGNPHTITDGKFTVSRAGNNNPPPNTDVQLTVWSKGICFDGSSIEVKVASQTGFISDAMFSEPACGAQGAATFTLPQGAQTVIAICGTDTLQYNVNLTAACVKLEVDFTHPPTVEDFLPLTIGSTWDFKDLAPGASTSHRRSAVSDTVLDGRLYTMVTSNLPDTSYYRKEDHVYYEYVTLDFNDFVQNPPSFEMVILHDDYQVNESWETQPVDIVLSGIGVKVKLVSTILRRDYSDNIAGVDYNDLIEVQTEIFFSSDGGATYQSSGSSYITVFAKNIGIVYYYDLDRGIDWGAYATSVVP